MTECGLDSQDEVLDSVGMAVPWPRLHGFHRSFGQFARVVFVDRQGRAGRLMPLGQGSPPGVHHRVWSCAVFLSRALTEIAINMVRKCTDETKPRKTVGALDERSHPCIEDPETWTSGKKCTNSYLRGIDVVFCIPPAPKSTQTLLVCSPRTRKFG